MGTHFGTTARRNRKAWTGVLSIVLFNALAIPGKAQDVAPKEPIALMEAAPATPVMGVPVVALEGIPGASFDAPREINSWLTCFSVGAKNWVSWGQSDSNFRSGAINPVSDLKWRNLVSEAGEINTSALFFGKVVVSADVGGGVISGGRLIDRDFAESGEQGLFSESIIPSLNDNLQYYNFELGWRFCESPCFVLDGLVGYQYWREHYVGDGGTQVVGLPGTIALPAGTPLPAGPGISEQYTWQGPQIGGQGIWQFASCWALKSRIMFMPVTWFENDDIHYLRSLTATDRATGGFGVMADFSVTCWLCKGLFIELGYRIWDVQSGRGQTTENFANGTEYELPFNQATTLRQGLILGLTYQF
jgi:hypothetical protein